MDADWLDAVLSETNGTQLVATIDGEPVALIGCIWATGPGEPYVITDVAVTPARRRQGIGGLAVDLVLYWPGHPPVDRWVAYVSRTNTAAAIFLMANEWRSEGLAENGMLSFTRQSPPGS